MGFEEQRTEMVEKQLRKRGVKDTRVLEAMQQVPRELFVPPPSQPDAYKDQPLPIGECQTISQPYMVAAMIEALELKGDEKVLEIGAGSGYQAAVLSLLAKEVVAVESKPLLAQAARRRLVALGYANVRIEVGDGSQGWPGLAPGSAVRYDAILVAAAAPAVPAPLIEQLADGGRLVIPVGSGEHQELRRIRKTAGQLEEEMLFACRFVPLVGRFAWHDVSLS